MPITCKNTDCNNTFLRTDPYSGGFCEDCYNEEQENKLQQGEEEDED